MNEKQKKNKAIVYPRPTCYPELDAMLRNNAPAEIYMMLPELLGLRRTKFSRLWVGVSPWNFDALKNFLKVVGEYLKKENDDFEIYNDFIKKYNLKTEIYIDEMEKLNEWWASESENINFKIAV